MWLTLLERGYGYCTLNIKVQYLCGLYLKHKLATIHYFLQRTTLANRSFLASLTIWTGVITALRSTPCVQNYHTTFMISEYYI